MVLPCNGQTTLMTSLCVIAIAYVATFSGLFNLASSLQLDGDDLLSSKYKEMTSSVIRGETPPPGRIAIVGGGISGTTSALFLRHMFGNDVTIDLFEPSDRLCGRVRTVEMQGRRYECGGSVLHPKNLYAVSLLNYLGLEKSKDETLARNIEFWGNTQSEFTMPSSSFMKMISILYNFGLNVFKMFGLISTFLNKFENIYKNQKNGTSYETVEKLLYDAGKEMFISATQQKGCDMFSDYGLSNRTIDILINGALNVNYGQNCNLNGFAGAVGIAGFQPGVWAVKGGNFQLCDKSFQTSNANLLNSAVTKIKLENGKFVVKTTGDSQQAPYDIVILATPLYYNGPNIDISEACSDPAYCPTNKMEDKEYRSTIATFVYGKLNPETFNCVKEECPKAVIKTKESFFRSVALKVPVDYDPDNDVIMNNEEGVYKVFSTESLTHQQLDELFEYYSDVKEIPWKAYPHFNPPEKLGKFILHTSGMYYTSPIEWSASAIEMSIISAKNAALLAYNRWFDLS